MLSVINMKLGNNNNNKIKKIYNKGDIIFIRPQNIKYPYKIISIKEKKMNLAENIKIIELPNHQNNVFTFNDICAISNFSKTKSRKENKLNKSILKDSLRLSGNNNKILNKKYSDVRIRKKIIDIERQRQIAKSIKNKISQRNFDDNIFLKFRYLSYNRNKLVNNENNIFMNTNNNINKIKDENSKQLYYDSTMLNNEKNKYCYKLKYDNLSSGIIFNDCDEKNLILKRNFDVKRNKKRKVNMNKSSKEIKFKRLKSSRLERKKSHEKIIYKMKRPFSSTDNRRKNHKINFEIKNANKCNKLEENKDTNKKCKKKYKIQKEIKNEDLKEICNSQFNNFNKLNKFKGFKSRKNSDIFDYIIIPTNSEEINLKKNEDIIKDFTEYKSVVNK